MQINVVYFSYDGLSVEEQSYIKVSYRRPRKGFVSSKQIMKKESVADGRKKVRKSYKIVSKRGNKLTKLVFVKMTIGMKPRSGMLLKGMFKFFLAPNRV